MAYSGSMALRLVGLEELLCGSAAFRARTGAADANQAKSKVYCGELTLEDVVAMLQGGTLSLARPCAIVGVNGHSYVQIGQGAAIELGVSAAAWLILTDAARTPEDHKTSYLDFVDWTSQVLDEVAAQCGQEESGEIAGATRWAFASAHLLFEPYRPDVMDRKTDDFWLAMYMFADSINGGGG